MPYAYICSACDHPMTGHGLQPGGDLKEGPYLCHFGTGCECSIRQGASDYEMAQGEFHRRFVRFGHGWTAAGNYTREPSP